MTTFHTRHSLASIGLAALLACVAQSAQAGFVSLVIRGTPTINTSVPGQTEFIIDHSGDKAALGSSDIDGSTLGSIDHLAIQRLDDTSRFTPGSGPAVAPYLNFWITDGLGHFAVAANEPSNPEWAGIYNAGYDLSFADLADKTVKIYETNDLSWLPDGGANLVFGDLAAFIVEAPSVAYLTAGTHGVGSGAPRELGSNAAYGVNWVFGDTLSNYVSGQQGYVVAGAAVSAAAVPEPGTLALVGLALVGVVGVRRRRA